MHAMAAMLALASILRTIENVVHSLLAYSYFLAIREFEVPKASYHRYKYPCVGMPLAYCS